MGYGLFRQLNSMKDQYLLRHHAGVALYAGLISLAICPRMADLVCAAAVIHDTGKSLIPDEMLFKPGKLTDNEWIIMQAHPVSGAQLFARDGIGFSPGEKKLVYLGILYHHERWDGAGYPKGLSGREIPLIARIIAVSDTFDAMTTDRAYRKAMSMDEALQELLRVSGSQHDPKLVEKFKEILSRLDLPILKEQAENKEAIL